MKNNIIIFHILLLSIIFIIGCNLSSSQNINSSVPGTNTITNTAADSTTTTTTAAFATTSTTTFTTVSTTTTTTYINNNYSTNTIDLYTNSKGIAPVFLPASISPSSIHTKSVNTFQSNNKWEHGNPLYGVFFSLREFVSPRDEGVIDRSNLHKFLYDVNTVYSGIASSVVLITEQEVSSPFSKLLNISCDKAINDDVNRKAAAIKETSNDIKAILTWIWTDSPQKNEYGIATVDFNNISKDLSIDMTYSVDYDLSSTETDYNLRSYVEGNPDQHFFKFKYIICDIKIVAQGISQGSGNYMLFKYTSGSDTPNYIVVPSDADESFFISENSNPTNIYTDPNDLPTSVSAYKDWVVSTDFFTSEDLMTNTNLLNIGNDKAGTIYLKYN